VLVDILEPYMMYVKFPIAGLLKPIILLISSLVMTAPTNLKVATPLIYLPPTKTFTCSLVFITRCL